MIMIQEIKIGEVFEYNGILSTKYSPDIMNAAYQMLCWVIENGHLETNK